ncbi:MAG: hypothetical protein HQK49_08995 [Oligoflexia bacterium]|nr:hypothetical protein [Oligoflexia bacterium]
MKILFCITLILIIYTSNAFSMINVSVFEDWGKVKKEYRLISSVDLVKKKDSLYCRSEKIPLHKISVKNLDDISSPFKATKKDLLFNCHRYVRWGDITTCIDENNINFLILHDLLRWCSNI